MLGYLRLMTSRGALIDPFSPSDAIGHVRPWLARAQVLVLSPGARHLDLFEGPMQAAGASGRLTTDVQLAPVFTFEHSATGSQSPAASSSTW